MKFLITINCLLFTLVLNGQQLDYYLFSDSSFQIDKVFRFENDSSLIVFPDTRSSEYDLENQGVNFNYKKNSDTIIVFNYDNNQDLYLLQKDNLLINNDRKLLLYIKNINHPYSNGLFYRIDKKEYFIKYFKTVNGIITKRQRKTKDDRRLKRKLRNISVKDYELVILRGYDAFMEFGYDYIFGVIVFEPKNKDD